MARVASEHAFYPGAVLSGKIRIERVVGQGSTGIVLEGTDLPLQRRVAVKVLSPERAAREESRKRFLREARAAARLSSEHIRRLIDVGELEDGTPYLVMEYLDGMTLEEVLVQNGPPEIAVALDWVLQALDGVAEAHRAGLVHRDLKPENLFLCERPDRGPIVKVLDFGTVKDLVTKGTKLTKSGATMGSPAYMPPEQVRADEIDQRADVWAMGVTLYELLTGRLPFIGETLPQTLTSILRDEPPPLRTLRGDVPHDVQMVVSCALSKDRTRRYASANELLGALASVKSRLSIIPGSIQRTLRLVTTAPVPLIAGYEAFADTTDMRGNSYADASTVRPRIIVRPPEAATLKETMPELPPPRRIGRRIGIAAAVVAVVGGGAFGAFSLFRTHPPAAPPTAATAPPVSAPPAVASVAPVTPPPPSAAPRLSASAPAASAPQARPPRKTPKR